MLEGGEKRGKREGKVMNYEDIKDLSPGAFKRMTGVRRETFEHLVTQLEPSLNRKGQRGGQTKLSVANQLLVCLNYWREYRTYFHLGQDFGIHESSVCRIVHKVEKLLAQCQTLHLPGKKHLRTPNGRYTTVVVDVTEVEIDRPQKNSSTTTVANRNAIRSKPR